MMSVRSTLYFCITTMRIQLCNVYSEEHVCVQQYNRTPCTMSSTQKIQVHSVYATWHRYAINASNTNPKTCSWLMLTCSTIMDHSLLICGTCINVSNGHSSISKQQRPRPLLEDNGSNVSKRNLVKIVVMRSQIITGRNEVGPR